MKHKNLPVHVGKWESLGDFTGILKNRQITKKNCEFGR